MNRPILASVLCLALVACAAKPVTPAVQIKVVERVVEVQRPCAATRPALPTKLVEPYPTDAVKLAIMLAQKLADYSGPGGYGERADSALALCLKH
jgi:hypothetical protein